MVAEDQEAAEGYHAFNYAVRETVGIQVDYAPIHDAVGRDLLMCVNETGVALSHPPGVDYLRELLGPQWRSSRNGSTRWKLCFLATVVRPPTQVHLIVAAPPELVAVSSATMRQKRRHNKRSRHSKRGSTVLMLHSRHRPHSRHNAKLRHHAGGERSYGTVNSIVRSILTICCLKD